MPGTICGSTLEEEITQEEFDCHILEVRKIFKVIVVGEKQHKSIGHTARKHRKCELITVIQSNKPRHTIFRSLKEERYARTEFLLRYEKEMQKKIREYKRLELELERKKGFFTKESFEGRKKDLEIASKFSRTIELRGLIGIGVIGEQQRSQKPGTEFELHQSFLFVTFSYYYKCGYWIEKTGFPDMDMHHFVYGQESNYLGHFLVPQNK